MKTYNVTVTREGKWWMVAIPELDGLTQARRLSEAPEMAREYIAVTRNIPIEEVDVNVSYDNVGAVKDIKGTIASIERYRTAAANLERSASRMSTQLAKSLSDEGVSVRDIGTILGVSFQRAQQLKSAEPADEREAGVKVISWLASDPDNYHNQFLLSGTIRECSLRNLPRSESSDDWVVVIGHGADLPAVDTLGVGGGTVALRRD